MGAGRKYGGIFNESFRIFGYTRRGDLIRALGRSEANLKTPVHFWSQSVHNIPQKFMKKFKVSARKINLIGYEGNSTNYRVYDSVSNKVSIS